MVQRASCLAHTILSAVVTELPSSVPIILPSLPPMLPLALPPTPGPLGPPSNYDMKFTTPAPYLQPMFDPAPGGALQASIGPMPIAPPHPGANPQVPFPNTPPQTTYTPPWASHNPFTISHTDMPGPPPSGLPFPVFPASPPPVNSPGIPPNGSPMSPAHRQDRRMSSISRTSMSSLRSSRNRNWSLTIAETPDGETRATGLVSDDGQYIAHGQSLNSRWRELTCDRSWSAYSSRASVWTGLEKCIGSGGLLECLRQGEPAHLVPMQSSLL